MDLKEAVRRSMQTEKNAMDFYLQAARQMKDAKAKEVFELLAKEEREHAHWFYDIYPAEDIGSFDDFIGKGPGPDSEWLTELEKKVMGEFSERKAMELALEKERLLEQHLREMAAKVDDAAVKSVFEQNAKSTHNHYVLIESEYARLMGMVHETDIDTYVRE